MTKKIPKFRNIEEEQKFWQKNDTTEYFDLSNPVDYDFSSLKIAANKRDMPYQSLMKVFLTDKLRQEFQTA